jgi:hypothetical protein
MTQTITTQTTAPVLETALQAFEAAKAALAKARADQKATEALKVAAVREARGIMKEFGITVEMLAA